MVMSEEKYDELKGSVLEHIQTLFDEMEDELAMSHQEKYALLEDALENASDEAELKVAFEQWYNDHSSDLGWDYEATELWDRATTGGGVELDDYEDEDDSGADEDEEEKENYGISGDDDNY